jgi:hypothetical protein
MFSPRALLPSSFCQTILDVSQDELLELLEEGLIAPAFNICCPGAKARELRILGAGLTYYASTQRPLPADVKEVVTDLAPPDAPITTTTLQKLFNCSQELVLDLIKSKAITLMAGETLRQGHGSKVNRHSVIAFLESRVFI